MSLADVAAGRFDRFTYARVPKQMVDSKVAEFTMDTRRELAVIWVEGEFTLPFSGSLACKALEEQRKWEIIEHVGRGYYLLSGTNTKDDGNQTVFLVNRFGRLKSKASIISANVEQLDALQRISILKSDRHLTYLLALAISYKIHILVRRSKIIDRIESKNLSESHSIGSLSSCHFTSSNYNTIKVYVAGSSLIEIHLVFK